LRKQPPTPPPRATSAADARRDASVDGLCYSDAGKNSRQEPIMTTLERAAVCTLDGPDTCSLTVTVDDGRIVKVRGSDALPYTEGVICNKVAHHSAEFVHGSGRLTHPLRRSGPRGSGRFERIGWQDALDEIHRRVVAV